MTLDTTASGLFVMIYSEGHTLSVVCTHKVTPVVLAYAISLFARHVRLLRNRIYQRTAHDIYDHLSYGMCVSDQMYNLMQSPYCHSRTRSISCMYIV